MKRLSGFTEYTKQTPQMRGWPFVASLYLRRGVEAALGRRAEGGVCVLYAVFDAGSSQHFYVGDGKDALTVGA